MGLLHCSGHLQLIFVMKTPLITHPHTEWFIRLSDSDCDEATEIIGQLTWIVRGHHKVVGHHEENARYIGLPVTQTSTNYLTTGFLQDYHDKFHNFFTTFQGFHKPLSIKIMNDT